MKPRTLMLLGMKGGTGKSTVAIHLAVAAMQAGHRVTLLDTDPQATTMTWARTRIAPAPHVLVAPAYEAGRSLPANDCDLLVIDTAPRAEADTTALAAQASLIVIPLRCTMPDLAAADAAFRMAKAARRPAVVVLNAINPRGLEVDEVREELTAQGHTLAPTPIAQRTAYARALSNGLAVTEFERRGLAAQEITQLWKWIEQRL
jgi:chromosome partitioning protein